MVLFGVAATILRSLEEFEKFGYRVFRHRSLWRAAVAFMLRAMRRRVPVEYFYDADEYLFVVPKHLASPLLSW
jgi:hypothetical protein